MAKPISSIDLPVNPAEPLIMHVDMNSCFATIEQQANPLIRNRPVAVSPYPTPRGIIIAPSVEAKKLGIKLGMRNQEAKLICPNIIILPPDPPKYRDAHIRFKKIFLSYTDKVVPKSIDEAVIDFSGSQIIKRKDMVSIAQEIKQRIKDEIGEWVRVSVGIGTNRFLAKVAAGLNKPDGLDLINKDNLMNVYGGLVLTDLPGINVRNEARLNTCNIFSPSQFFDAPIDRLKKNVFQSVLGYYWYLRLRGWEIDDVDYKRKSFGHTYALGQKTASKEELAKLLMKLCIKTGQRLRTSGYWAEGVHVALLFSDRTYWHKSKNLSVRLYSDQSIFNHAVRLLNSCYDLKLVSNLAISVFNLKPNTLRQISIFDSDKQTEAALINAVDDINSRYGQFVITPALILGMNDIIVDRVAFGGVKDLEDLYNNKQTEE